MMRCSPVRLLHRCAVDINSGRRSVQHLIQNDVAGASAALPALSGMAGGSAAGVPYKQSLSLHFLFHQGFAGRRDYLL